GEYIVVIDDDETVVPVFLERYYDLFESEPGTAAAGGRILPGFEGVPPRWMSACTERAIAGTLDLGDRARAVPEGPCFGRGTHGCRRSVVARYGGRGTALRRTGSVLLAGEEKEFYGRLRAGTERIVYLPDAVIYHLVDAGRLTRGYFLRLC